MKQADWFNLKRNPEFKILVEEMEEEANGYLKKLADGSSFYQPKDQPGSPLWIAGFLLGIGRFTSPDIEEEKEESKDE
jgi:hypothetical protein